MEVDSLSITVVLILCIKAIMFVFFNKKINL